MRAALELDGAGGAEVVGGEASAVVVALHARLCAGCARRGHGRDLSRRARKREREREGEGEEKRWG